MKTGKKGAKISNVLIFVLYQFLVFCTISVVYETSRILLFFLILLFISQYYFTIHFVPVPSQEQGKSRIYGLLFFHKNFITVQP